MWNHDSGLRKWSAPAIPTSEWERADLAAKVSVRRADQERHGRGAQAALAAACRRVRWSRRSWSTCGRTGDYSTLWKRA